MKFDDVHGSLPELSNFFVDSSSSSLVGGYSGQSLVRRHFVYPSDLPMSKYISVRRDRIEDNTATLMSNDDDGGGSDVCFTARFDKIGNWRRI